MRTKLKDHSTRGQFDRYGNDDRPDGAAGEDGCGRLGVRSDRRKPQPWLRLVNGLPLSRWFAFAFSGSGSSCISSRNWQFLRPSFTSSGRRTVRVRN